MCETPFGGFAPGSGPFHGPSAALGKDAVVQLFKKREERLFRTHQPAFRAPEWAVGQVVQHGERLYRVTRWEELPAVYLERGGSVPEWQIWGQRLSESEMRAEVLEAADRITSGEA